MGNREAVLSWIVEGARRWYKNGKQMPPAPESVRRDTDEWRMESDLVLRYVTERLEFDPDCAVPATEFAEAFDGWLRTNGQQPWGTRTMTPRFREHTCFTSRGIVQKKIRSDAFTLSRASLPPAHVGATTMAWVGVRFGS